MKLRDWRKDQKLTQNQVAEKLAGVVGAPVTHDQISRIENGQLPSRELGAAIVALTDGKVAPADFYASGKAA